MELSPIRYSSKVTLAQNVDAAIHLSLVQMRRSIDLILAALIPLSILLHLFIAPYTKVEESFNIQATHDILTYGLPIGQHFATKLRDNFDHLTFTGPVPRTFVGPLALATVSWPASLLLDGVNRQILVRATLGLFNAFCLLSFRNGVLKVFGRNAANWFVVFQAGQFHMMYYASRTLSNFFAFGFTTIALRDLLPISETSLGQSAAKHRYERALLILTAVGVIFRSEIALLLGTHTLYLLVFKRRSISLFQDIIPAGLLGLLTGFLLTVPLDSYFWLRFPLWPELSAFSYNILSGHASNWGTSPVHFYLTSALPRLLFNPFVYQICLPFMLALPYLRPQVCDILLPNLAFVALYSFQPHKEWRFIIYIIPPILAVASAGAAWMWTRRAKSSIYRLLALCLIASSLASFGASFAMLAVSSFNYPGAEALEQLHRTHHAQNGEQKEVVRVHMDILTCMTGVTRFLQIPPPALSEPGAREDKKLNAGGSTMWIYDKTEDPERLLHPSFWDQFDYALAEKPERVIGSWEIVGTAVGYAGMKLVRPGEKSSLTLNTKGAAAGPWWQQMELLWRAVESFCRSSLTRGWWFGVKLEPRVRILRKQRERFTGGLNPGVDPVEIWAPR